MCGMHFEGPKDRHKNWLLCFLIWRPHKLCHASQMLRNNLVSHHQSWLFSFLQSFVCTGCFLTIPPNFQNQNENQVSAKQSYLFNNKSKCKKCLVGWICFFSFAAENMEEEFKKQIFWLTQSLRWLFITCLKHWPGHPPVFSSFFVCLFCVVFFHLCFFFYLSPS